MFDKNQTTIDDLYKKKHEQQEQNKSKEIPKPEVLAKNVL